MRSVVPFRVRHVPRPVAAAGSEAGASSCSLTSVSGTPTASTRGPSTASASSDRLWVIRKMTEAIETWEHQASPSVVDQALRDSEAMKTQPAKVTTAAVNEAQRNWERAPPAERPPGMFVHKLEA